MDDATPQSEGAAPLRRNLFRFAGMGVAATALAQVREEANTESPTITRKGIDKAFEAFNIHTLTAAKRWTARLPRSACCPPSARR